MEIKETMEVLDGIIVLIDEYKKAMEDGGIGYMDIPKLVPIFWAIKGALDGVSQVSAELKDLDDAELSAIFAKITEITAMIIEIMQPKTE